MSIEYQSKFFNEKEIEKDLNEHPNIMIGLSKDQKGVIKKWTILNHR